MQFQLKVEASEFPCYITNIYSLHYLGIHNTHRMGFFVKAGSDDFVKVAKAVYKLAIGITKYHGKIQVPGAQIGAEALFSYHFTISGQKPMLQAVRDALGIIGEDPEEEIEEFDDDPGVDLSGLNLG
jgi:hypothetical protein